MEGYREISMVFTDYWANIDAVLCAVISAKGGQMKMKDHSSDTGQGSCCG